MGFSTRRGPKGYQDGRQLWFARIRANDREKEAILNMVPNQRRQACLTWIAAQKKIANRDESIQAGRPRRRGDFQGGRQSWLARIRVNDQEKEAIRNMTPNQRRQACIAWIAEQKKIVNHDEAIQVAPRSRGRKKLYK